MTETVYGLRQKVVIELEKDQAVELLKMVAGGTILSNKTHEAILKQLSAQVNLRPARQPGEPFTVVVMLKNADMNTVIERVTDVWQTRDTLIVRQKEQDHSFPLAHVMHWIER